MSEPRYKCPFCDIDMHYSPFHECYYCPHCGSLLAVEQILAHQKLGDKAFQFGEKAGAIKRSEVK